MDDGTSRIRVAAVLLLGLALATVLILGRGANGVLSLAFAAMLGLVVFPGVRVPRRADTVGTSAGGVSGERYPGEPDAVDRRSPARQSPAFSTHTVPESSRAAESAAGFSGWQAFVATLVLCLLGWMLLHDIGHNPPGLFADEAEIGLHAQRLVSQGLDELRPFLFYSHFGYGHLGALPVYASAPAIALLGLTDISVRRSSVIWSMAAVLVLVALVRQLRWRNGELAIVLFAFSPIFIHMSRINFGHAPSLLCVSVGLYAYARARATTSFRWAMLCGVALGLSVYGYSSYYLAAPVIALGLFVAECVASRFAWRSYRLLGVVALVLAVVWSPVVFQALTNERFTARFSEKEKTEAPLLSIERMLVAIENYPKYYSPKYLFEVGEAGLPGGFISRHSVPGAGLLPWIALPLVVLGVIAIFRARNDTGRVFAVAGLTILLLYPLPDLVTTSQLNPPYTFAVFPTLIFVPLLAGYGIHWASDWLRRRWAPFWSARLLPAGLLVILLLGSMQFYTGPYGRYPEVAAGYDGWQFGSRQAIDAFEARAYGYDRYVFDPDFNRAYVFLDFYLADDPELRAKSVVGSTELVDWHQDSLFAIRTERFDKLMTSGDPLRRYVHVLDTIPYPDGTTALYIVEISLEHQRPPGAPW